MTFNLQDLSDEELDQLISQSQNNQQDLSTLSNEELDALISQQSPPDQQRNGIGLQDIMKGLLGAAPSIGARAFEGVVGLPGQIRQGVSNIFETIGIPQSLLQSDPSALTGLGGPSPTPEDLREINKQLTGEVFEPRNEIEAIAGEMAQDAAQLALPFAGPGLSAYRSLGAAIGGNLAKQGLIHSFDIDDGMADLAKLPVYLLAAGGGLSKKEFVDQSWQRVEDLVENRVVSNADGYVKRLKDFANNLQKGGLTDQQAKVLEKVQQLLKRIETGTFEMDELLEANKVINSSLRDFKNFDANGRALLQGYKNLIGEGVEQFATPELLSAWKEANLASSALGAQNSLQKAFVKVFKGSDLDPATRAILTFTFPKATATIKAGKFLQDRVNLMNRIMGNPVAKEFYVKSIQAALQNKPAIALKNAKELDKIIKESTNLSKEVLQ